jgi:hypothetical protein
MLNHNPYPPYADEIEIIDIPDTGSQWFVFMALNDNYNLWAELCGDWVCSL